MDKEELRVKKKIEVNMRKHKHKIGIIKEFQTIPSLEYNFQKEKKRKRCSV